MPFPPGCYPKSQKPLSVPFVGALDAFTSGLILALSLCRRLLTAYTGPLIRVRRSSDDDEADFYPQSNGFLDAAAVLAFCGAGDGFVTNIYLQGGDGADAVQATTSLQCKIVAAGTLVAVGSFPAVRAPPGGGVGYTATLGTRTPTALSYCFVGVPGGAGDYFGQVGGPAAAYAPGGGGLLYNETSDEVNCVLDWRARGNAITISPGAGAALGCVLGPSALTFYGAGVAGTPAAYSPSFNFDSFGLWYALATNASKPAKACEMILWAGDQSAAVVALGAEQTTTYGL